MKNFKDIRNLINEFVERENNWGSGGGDGDDGKGWMRLQTAMHRIPFEHTTRDGHQIKYNSSTEAMVDIAKHLANHDEAFVHHYAKDPNSRMADYHEYAGNRFSEIYEALRNHVSQHPKIAPEYRTHTNKLFNMFTDTMEKSATHPNSRAEIMRMTQEHEQHQNPFADLQRELRERPDSGYFLHKDEIE